MLQGRGFSRPGREAAIVSLSRIATLTTSYKPGASGVAPSTPTKPDGSGNDASGHFVATSDIEGDMIASLTRLVSGSMLNSASESDKLPDVTWPCHYLDGGAYVESCDMSSVASMVARKTARSARWDSLKIVFVLVGLPARGKSFISMRMQAFLNWIGVETKIFNVGQYRRQVETQDQGAAYFDMNNEAVKASRDTLAFEVLDRLMEWLDARPQGAAIFDATNSTADRRRQVQQRILQKDPQSVVIFVESFCNDNEVVEANIRRKLAKSPDYEGIPYEEAWRDFRERIAHYERAYETLDDTGMKESELSYIKMINLSSHLVAHRVYGLAASELLPYLMSLHIGTRPVWLVRMGEAERGAGQHLQKGFFADTALSDKGEVYARRLAAHFAGLRECDNARVLVCSHRRSLEMAALIDSAGTRTSVRPFLNPMDWGAYEDMPRQDVLGHTDHDFFRAFQKDPINTRFPGGESLADFVRRLQPVLVEIEQQVEPCIVIAPLSALQLLSCYFSKKHVSEALDYAFPPHSAVEWRPDGVSFAATSFSVDQFPEAPEFASKVRGDPGVRKKRHLAVGSIMYQRGSSL